MVLTLLRAGIRTGVVFSKTAAQVVPFELPKGFLTKLIKSGDCNVSPDYLNKFDLTQENLSELRVYDNSNLFAPVASGSEGYTHMVVAPCSMGTLGRVSHGMSQNLLERAADVMLKEKRPLVLMVRETPFNELHLENMLRVSRAGAHILPASPGFYFHPKTLSELAHFMVERAISLLKLENAPDKKIIWAKNKL